MQDKRSILRSDGWWSTVSSWRSLLDELATLDPADFDPADLADEELRELIPLAQLGINRLCALQTQAITTGRARRIHDGDGMASMKPWLTAHCRISGREATALVRAGRRLEGLPELADAYATGAVTRGHVDAVTAAVTPARAAKAAEAGIDLSVTDKILTEAARTLGPEDTAQAVQRWVIGIDPDGTLDDAAGQARNFRMAPSAGGRSYLSGHLDAVGTETVHTALEAVMNGHRPAGDSRSHAERQGDALVELCRQALNGGALPDVRGERPHVRVSIDLMALCAERNALGMPAGELPFAGPISPETARRLACDSVTVRILTGPGALPLDVGRAQRTAPVGIRRAVEARDGHCVFTGCTAPPAWCDIHHTPVHWAHGGVTSEDNSALVCERHHTACHEGGFRVERDARGQWRTFRADGTEVLVRAGPAPPRDRD